VALQEMIPGCRYRMTDKAHQIAGVVGIVAALKPAAVANKAVAVAQVASVVAEDV